MEKHLQMLRIQYYKDKSSQSIFKYNAFPIKIPTFVIEKCFCKNS